MRESYQRELLLIAFFQRKQLSRDIINCILQWAKLTYLEILQILLRPGPLVFPMQWRPKKTVTSVPLVKLYSPTISDKVTIAISNRNHIFVRGDLLAYDSSFCLKPFWDRIRCGQLSSDQNRILLEAASKTYLDSLFDMVIEY